MNKQEFKQEAKNQIDEMFSKIEELEKKKDDVSSDMKKDYNEKIDELKMKKKELELKMGKAEQTSEDQWEQMKENFNESLSHFKKGFSSLTK